MADVFISYKREEKETARLLAGALEKLGFQVWWDIELRSGDRYEKVIRAVIDRCKAAVVLWSHRAADSDFIVDEADHARKLGKLYPARIDNAPLPFGFGRLHTDDLTGWTGATNHPGFMSLVQALDKKVGKRSGHLAAKQNAEFSYFTQAEYDGSAKALTNYLVAYPQGLFTNFVRNQLSEAGTAPQLSPPPPRPPPSAPRPAWAIAGLSGPPSPRLRLNEDDDSDIDWKRILIAPAAMGALLLVGVVGVFAFNAASHFLPSIGGGGEIVSLPAEAAAEESESSSEDDGAPLLPLEPYGPNEGLTDRESDAANQAYPSPVGAAYASYEISQLPPDTRRIVELARDRKAAAEAAAAKARSAASKAEDAARRARNGEAGYRMVSYGSGDDRARYEGAWSSDQLNGYGVRILLAGAGAGDRYAGLFFEGYLEGVGFYRFAENPRNTLGAVSYSGEIRRGQTNGLGVYIQHDARYSGEFLDSLTTGLGVIDYPDGRRYEGQLTDHLKFSGIGALWDADGKLEGAGMWISGKLAEPKDAAAAR